MQWSVMPWSAATGFAVQYSQAALVAVDHNYLGTHELISQAAITHPLQQTTPSPRVTLVSSQLFPDPGLAWNDFLSILARSYFSEPMQALPIYSQNDPSTCQRIQHIYPLTPEQDDALRAKDVCVSKDGAACLEHATQLQTPENNSPWQSLRRKRITSFNLACSSIADPQHHQSRLCVVCAIDQHYMHW